MPFDDLDLEFEDEDETKKKKNEAFHVDVDLEFQAPVEAPRTQSRPSPRPAAPAGAQPSAPSSQPAPAAPAAPGVVRKIEDARPNIPQARKPTPDVQPSNQPARPRVVGSSALKEESSFEFESEQMVELREQMRKVQFEADVKVQVAEFKTEILTEMLSDMKLAEHQIGQLLVRINAKHPDMKNEVLMIKKILADFTSKKRK